MTDMSEDRLEDSAMSGEENEEKTEKQGDQASPKKGRVRGHAVGDILEGKRTKKTVERLDFQISKPKEKLKIEDGGGDKLGDIPRTNYEIGKMKPGDLKPLHLILYDRPGKLAVMRKSLRLFNGFPFDAGSDQYNKKREKLLRTTSFTNTKLRVICKVLDLEKKGTHPDLVDRILTFLTAPKNSGKPLLSKKKRKKSKKKLSGDDSKSKPRAKSTSASPKKSKAGSKSKAIVMDSSSEDDEDEEDEKADFRLEDKGSSDRKAAKKELVTSEDEGDEGEEEEQEEQDEDEQEEDEQEEEEEEQEEDEPKAAAKKPGPAKRQRTPAKKSTPPRKRQKKVDTSDQSDSDGDQQPQKTKRAAKTKKADSSSASKKRKAVMEQSSDDEPLIKMVKKPPTDEQLKEMVQNLLQEVNLEEVTMKQICQRVYDAYPEHDLTSKKDYIKHTVKSLIT